MAAKRPCQFFASGLCKRGEQCAYNHDLPTPVAQPAAKKEKKAKVTKAAASVVAPVAATASTSVNLDRTCIECETPDIASWQCAKCDDSLYCDSCNELVHKSKVMKSHERVKLAPIPVIEEKKNPTCDECEESESSVMCEQCEVVLCADCDASVHKFKSLRSHTRTELVQSASAPVPAPVAVAVKPVTMAQEPVLKKQKVAKTEAIAAPAPASAVPEISYIESVPKYDLTSESESDDEAESEQQQQEEQEEDESMDSDEDESPIVVNAFPPQSVTNATAVAQKKQVAVAKPVAPAPAPVVQNGAISSESSDDEDERPVVLAAPVVRKVAPVAAKPAVAAAAPVTSAANPHEVSSDSESSSDDEDVKPKSAPITTISKPSAAADSSSSDEASSSDDDEDVVAKPVAKAPAPVVKKAPSAPKVSYGGSVNPGISTGSSHSLVKKIEAYSESGATETLHLDANLNGFERLLAHDCAERLGLQHVSVGEGLERHITIFRR